MCFWVGVTHPRLSVYVCVCVCVYLCVCVCVRLLHSSVDDMCCQLSRENSLLRYRLFPAWLGTERVTGQGVYWNTVFSSAAAAVQLQYSRNIVLLCGFFPRPAPSFYTKRPPTTTLSLPPSLSLSLSLPLLSMPLSFSEVPGSMWLLHRHVYHQRGLRGIKEGEEEEERGGQTATE